MQYSVLSIALLVHTCVCCWMADQPVVAFKKTVIIQTDESHLASLLAS